MQRPIQVGKALFMAECRKKVKNMVYDGFFLALGVFPAVALVVGLVTGALSNRYWAGAVGGTITTLVLTVTVANDSLLAWLPVHAAVGFIGGALGCLVRRVVTGWRRGRP